MRILDNGNKTNITIGVSNKDFPQNVQVGLADKSYGYKADGKIYSGKKNVFCSFRKFVG